nr:UdgX family uracil-DNA binding protein [Sinirhodobacter populi]
MGEAREAALQCRRCGLCEAATQTVWGEGLASARLMIVGEQPGDREDLEGRPFVGPAGQLLRVLMAEAQVDAGQVWLTNAVKHFKFAPRGKQRLHQNPDRQEILHCRWWLGLELSFIRPRMVLALGASAAFALTGNDAPLGPRRGQTETGLHGGQVLISWHPSGILRQTDTGTKMRRRAELTEDIAAAARVCGFLPLRTDPTSSVGTASSLDRSLSTVSWRE